jgi:hypothetical protein
LKPRKRISGFDTSLDFGGRRLAINPRGDIDAVASDQLRGPDCYTADSGKVICGRDDLKKRQRIGYKL